MSRHNTERVRRWRELIEAWKQSGQTINAFCRDHQLTRSNFDRWRRILSTEPSESKLSSSSAFVPLRITAEPMAEVVLRSGVLVRLPLGADPEAVTRLVASRGGGLMLSLLHGGRILVAVESVDGR
jgi:transposase-like protein